MNDTLMITIGVHLNCAGNLKGSFIIKNDTLNLKTDIIPNRKGVTITTECNCFYHLTYVIKSLKEIQNNILINNRTFSDNNNNDAGIIELKK